MLIKYWNNDNTMIFMIILYHLNFSAIVQYYKIMIGQKSVPDRLPRISWSSNYTADIYYCVIADLNTLQWQNRMHQWCHITYPLCSTSSSQCSMTTTWSVVHNYSHKVVPLMWYTEQLHNHLSSKLTALQ